MNVKGRKGSAVYLRLSVTKVLKALLILTDFEMHIAVDVST